VLRYVNAARTVENMSKSEYEVNRTRRGGTGVRQCGYSRCRRVLPENGTGPKFQYCPDRTWDLADGRTSTCKQAGAAENLLRALHGDDSIPDLVVVELGERVDAVLGPVEQLRDGLLAARAELQSAVARAHQERDAAVSAAVEERRLRVAAEEMQARVDADRAQLRTEAGEAKQQAVEDRRAAEQAGRRERAADDERSTAIGARDAALEQARTAEGRAALAQQKAERLGDEAAGLRAKLQAAEDALGEAQRRENDEVERGRRAAVEAGLELQGERDRAATAAREAATRLTSEREKVAALGTTRLQDAERHGQALAELHGKLGALQQDVESATRQYGETRTTLERWKAALVDAVSRSAGSATAEDPVRIRARALLQAPAQDEGGDGDV
jgi:chromosome segregation ATPase